MSAFLRPLPPSIGKRLQWGHPSPLKYADILNGWSLILFLVVWSKAALTLDIIYCKQVVALIFIYDLKCSRLLFPPEVRRSCGRHS